MVRRDPFDVFRLLGIIYGAIGLIFGILGVAFVLKGTGGELGTVGTVFSILGASFLFLGGGFLGAYAVRRRRDRALMESGRYIWGEVVDISPNYRVRVNGRSPMVFTVRHRDSRGNEHLFRSRNVDIYRDERLLGKQVKIYIRDERFRTYYVDLDPILPNYIKH